MSLSDRPVYDPNPLKPNRNPKKPVSSLCRVRGLGRTLTPLLTQEWATHMWHPPHVRGALYTIVTLDIKCFYLPIEIVIKHRYSLLGAVY